MKLEEVLQNNEDEILKKWVAYTLSTYQSSRMFKKQKDQFANPIGGCVRETLKTLLPLLIKGGDSSVFRDPLSHFMHLRAVQEFSPSQAVAPINAVKHITREILETDKQSEALMAELYDFEFAVDLAVLAAFDLYVECREKVYKVRIGEIKSGAHIITDSACPSKALKDIPEIKKENRK